MCLFACLSWFGVQAQITQPMTGTGTATSGVDFVDGDSFFDSGGAAGDYSVNEISEQIICAAAGETITVTFTAFNLEAATSCWDQLIITGDQGGGDGTYAGDDDDEGAGLACIDGTDDTGAPILPVFTSAEGGCLTFLFDSDGSAQRSGWEATINVDGGIVDPEECAIIVPSDINSTLGSGECDATISYVVTTTGNCEGLDAVQTVGLASGEVFPVGTTTNTFEITLADMTVVSESFDVTVNAFGGATAAPACNGQANVTLDGVCEAEVTAGIVLLGNNYSCFDTDYEVSLFFDEAMTLPVAGSPIVGSAVAGENLYASVEDLASGISCWGRVLVEDKTGPEITCPCAAAAVTSYDSELLGAAGPLFERPDGSGTGCSLNTGAEDHAYDVFTFTVDADGMYTLTMEDTPDFDGYGLLYLGAFDPSNPCDNWLAGNDDDGGGNEPEITISLELTAGTYSLVSTHFFSGNPQSGAFTWNFSGPGNILAGDNSACEFECNDLESLLDGTHPNNPVATATDACGSASVTYTDVVSGTLMACEPVTITRTFTATDATGRTATCETVITVNLPEAAAITTPPNYDDIDQPALLCELKDECNSVGGWKTIKAGDFPDDLYVGHPSPDAGMGFCTGTGRPGGAATCSTIQSTFEDLRINVCPSGASEGCYKIIRTWTILDWCAQDGGITTHTQIIKVADKQGPTISDITDVTISTDVWSCDATYYIPNPWLDDNCSDIVGFTVSVSSGTLTYSNALQQYVVSGLALGTHQITYTASDCCGNETVETYDITVEDLVPPVAVCDVFHTVSLTIDGTAKVFAQTFDDGSHDNCGPVYFKTIRMEDLLGTDHGSDSNQSATDCDIANGDDSASKSGNQIYYDDYAKFCCEDIGDDIMVVLRVFDVDPGDGPVNPNRMKQGGDLHGHYNDCMVEITVEDKLPPYIVCPTDLTISCDYWFDFNNLDEFGSVVTDASDRDSIVLYDRATCNGDATVIRKSLGIDGIAADNCGVVVTENATDGRVCGQGTITRIFTATDPDGRTASCVQRITVIDCDPFYINDTDCNNRDRNDGVKWPCDYDASSCGAETDPSVAGEPQVFNEDNCSLVSVDYDDEVYTIQADACLKIKRTWVITDWCNFDQTDSDNNDHYDYSDDGYVRGKWSYIQWIKVLNSTDPVFSGCDDVVICGYEDGCVGAVSLPVTVEDDCTPVSDLTIDYKIDYNNDGTYDETVYGSLTATGTYPYGTHRILWNAEDQCGNVGSCTYLFTIEDCKEPTPYCDNGLTIPVMPATGSITVWANDFNEGGFDNCTDAADLEYRISTSNIGPGAPLPPASATSVTLDCDDVAAGSVNVNVFVIDEAGNWDYCTTFINVQDQTGVCDGSASASIAGTITNEEGEGVDQVSVDVDGSSMNDNDMSTTNGTFDFPSLPMNQNYTVTPERLDNPLNGISTFDLVLISKHILNIDQLDSPYKLIAADVNNSGTITTLDMVALRKLILYIDTDFQSNNSWRFVDADFVFPDATNPFATSFPEIYSVNSLSANEVADFVAVKVGDVNGNATANALAQASDRNKEGSLVFSVADQDLAKGEEVTVDFKANDFDAMLGYQFSLGFDTDAVEFVETAGLDANNFGFAMLNEGVITASWNSKEATTVANDEVVFSVTFRATDNVKLSEVIEMNSRYTAAEAYNSNLELMDVAIEFNGNVVEAAFDLYQNQPNPFKDATVIGFNLPEASAATLTVYDVSGKVLRLVEGDFAKGFNQVSLTRSELAGSGILYYTLETANDSQTKKMILID